MKKHLLFIIFSLLFLQNSQAQHSIARRWNEVLLDAIRLDYARPTVHARNLFHNAVATYDAWGVYNTNTSPYLLGTSLNGFNCPFSEFTTTTPQDSAIEMTISYASYRLLSHRFLNSPNSSQTQALFDALFDSLNYDQLFISTDYSTGNPAALGNYIGQCLIDYGLQDNSNEQNGYANNYYTSINPSLIPFSPGNPTLVDPNRWQPLTLKIFIDQGGNIIPGETPDFLSPEWGNVLPFSLKNEDKTLFNRGGDDYIVYHDPGPPPYLDTTNAQSLWEEYIWGFQLVGVWASHLDPADSIMWDISPANIGNNTPYPTTFPEYRNFYQLEQGGDASQGWSQNPATGQPYTPQLVPRGDYTRVLAEFWADGPDSETPPGHWFTILNYVSDHPAIIKKINGTGPTLSDLEWDVKAYFMLAGAMHDAAITAWGIKGWYDYIRPISALRHMADLGQSTDSSLSNYHPLGIPLLTNVTEIVDSLDPLAGSGYEHVGKIKLKSWKGPDYVTDPLTTYAGVDWILIENWWTYQRSTFITPPFAGYISGHSTFSRAAAEILSLLTGDPFFPGGIGEFTVKKNQFLVFEDGPSQDFKLQWATYKDASDQTSLSRIWGGIHPPADDIPGRIIGKEIGIDAYQFALEHFNGTVLNTNNKEALDVMVYPTTSSTTFHITTPEAITVQVIDLSGKLVETFTTTNSTQFGSEYISGSYILEIQSETETKTLRIVKR